MIIREYLAKNFITLLEHPLYSPDLAPCDFFLFPKMKNVMKGQHFLTVEALQGESWRALKATSKEAFSECFDAWRKRMLQYFNSGGEYFEGDHIEIDVDLE